MELSAISTEAMPVQEPKNEATMREAAEQVEGLFLKMLMKEGMKSMIDSAAGHSASAMTYALEQAAEEAGRAGSLGIADQIYEQLSCNL